jgi:hypothetical protein
MDTAEIASEQSPLRADTQSMAMGPIIEALWRLKGDTARQVQIFWIAAGLVLEMPSLTVGEKLLLIALYRRVDFSKGVVDDSHAWLAKWLHISKRAVQSYRKALASKGITIERQRQIETGDMSNETAFPMLAKLVLEEGWQSLLPPVADFATKEGSALYEGKEIQHFTHPDGSGKGDDDASHPLVVLRDWRQSRFFVQPCEVDPLTISQRILGECKHGCGRYRCKRAYEVVGMRP